MHICGTSPDTRFRQYLSKKLSLEISTFILPTMMADSLVNNIDFGDETKFKELLIRMTVHKWWWIFPLNNAYYSCVNLQHSSYNECHSNSSKIISATLYFMKFRVLRALLSLKMFNLFNPSILRIASIVVSRLLQI